MAVPDRDDRHETAHGVSKIGLENHCLLGYLVPVNENRLFRQYLCQAQILILKILRVCLRLKLSPSLILNKKSWFSFGHYLQAWPRDTPRRGRLSSRLRNTAPPSTFRYLTARQYPR